VSADLRPKDARSREQGVYRKRFLNVAVSLNLWRRNSRSRGVIGCKESLLNAAVRLDLLQEGSKSREGAHQIRVITRGNPLRRLKLVLFVVMLVPTFRDLLRLPPPRGNVQPPHHHPLVENPCPELNQPLLQEIEGSVLSAIAVPMKRAVNPSTMWRAVDPELRSLGILWSNHGPVTSATMVSPTRAIVKSIQCSGEHDLQAAENQPLKVDVVPGREHQSAPTKP